MIGAAAGGRVAALLRMLAARLNTSRYYLGDRLTPWISTARHSWPCSSCSARALRDGHHKPGRNGDTRSADRCPLDPVLLRHRDMMYAEHLDLPLPPPLSL